MNRTQKAVAHHLRQQREVHVDEARRAGIDLLAQIGVGLIGSPEANGFGFGERAIERWAGGSAGEARRSGNRGRA